MLVSYLFAFEGKVVKITDGDTITVLSNNTQIKVRLNGIDAPESKQAYGQASRKNLADLCAGEIAEIEDKGKDRYKRTLGVVTCKGIEANRKQVQDGYAWAYRKYSKIILAMKNRQKKIDWDYGKIIIRLNLQNLEKNRLKPLCTLNFSHIKFIRDIFIYIH
ncbi:MAG: thermonuclease family protein [Endomicrobium sp.]|nr:thermonuclease family protein [Endomicrobium sp.]